MHRSRFDSGLSTTSLTLAAPARRLVFFSSYATMDKMENGRRSVDTGSIRTLSSSHIDDESSLGSDSEINGFASERQADKYGFIGGAQKYSEDT